MPYIMLTAQVWIDDDLIDALKGRYALDASKEIKKQVLMAIENEEYDWDLEDQ